MNSDYQGPISQLEYHVPRVNMLTVTYSQLYTHPKFPLAPQALQLHQLINAEADNASLVNFL
jgi:hypothetical protein